jgi:hypothetical protein
VVAEHSNNPDHQIQLQNTNILARMITQMAWILRKVTEVEVYPDNINKKNGFSLIRTWKPLIHDLKE